MVNTESQIAKQTAKERAFEQESGIVKYIIAREPICKVNLQEILKPAELAELPIKAMKLEKDYDSMIATSATVS